MLDFLQTDQLRHGTYNLQFLKFIEMLILATGLLGNYAVSVTGTHH